MFIFAGSYERFIFGFSASADCSQPQEVVKRYTFAAHKSAVKCLVAAGPYVASGGADDLIHLYDMKAERDLGVLMNPCDGAVPCLEFYTPEGRSTPSHMLSGSADGGINIWRCKDWEHLKVMRGHKGAVNSLAVHHSGKLALSTARDRAIRIWNLTNGRVTYVAPLEAEAEEVAFLPSGDSYMLLAGSQVTVHSTAGEGALMASYTAPRRILCTAHQSDQQLLLGLEDGSVRVWDVRTNGVVGGWERAHGSRVRSMAVLQEGADKLPASLVTASSDGTIKLWDTRMLGRAGGSGSAAAATPPPCTAQVSTGARLTCLAAVDPGKVALVRTKPDTISAAAGARAGAAGAKAAPSAAPTGKAAKKGQAAAAAVEGAKGAGAKSKGGEKPGKPGKQPQAMPKAQQQQPQQQRQQRPTQGKPAKPQAAKQQGRGGRIGGGGASGRDRDDDPGFEIVPADRYEEEGARTGGSRDGDAEDGPRGRGAAGASKTNQTQRQQRQQQQQPTGRGPQVGKKDRKRRAVEGSADGEAEEGAGVRQTGGEEREQAGPSGRQQRQREESQERPAGGKQPKQQQLQRPLKKAKLGGDGGGPGAKGGAGSGGGVGQARGSSGVKARQVGGGTQRLGKAVGRMKVKVAGTGPQKKART